MNRTPNLELVLYEANDIMDGVEFINDNNSKIDTYASQTRAIAQSANALAGQANEGVGAADTKIEAINTRLQQDEVDTLPQYKTETDTRLDNLEDDVNSFIAPVLRYSSVVTENINSNVYESGGMLFSSAFLDTRDTYVNNSLKTANLKNEVSTSLIYRRDLSKVSGNVYNIKNVNVIYYVNALCKYSESELFRGNVGIYYNGVDTILTILGTNAINGNVYIYGLAFPVGMLKSIVD